jgi:hypothetical protein
MADEETIAQSAFWKKNCRAYESIVLKTRLLLVVQTHDARQYLDTQDVK